MRVGIFDSGVGGLTVLNDAIKRMPTEDFIYFADTYNVPYGIKPKEEVKKYIFEVVSFLNSRDIEALLIACNTATSIGVEELRKEYRFPIIGMEPAVKLGLNFNKEKKVLVLATPLTLKLEKYIRLVENLDANNMVDSLALPGLVEFAEDYIFDKSIIMKYLQKKFALYNFEEYGALVLGCTHFIYYKDFIKEIVPEHITIVDGNIGTVNHLMALLNFKPFPSHTGKVEFYQSTPQGVKLTQLDKYMQLLG